MTVPSNPYPALARAIDPTILNSIKQASQSSTADFGLLMAQAARESSFRADAKSSSSSAAGLFQFVDSTWLDMVHRFGAKYGIGDLAQQISETSTGKLVVSNPSLRQKILDLRQNPALSADLAGEYAKLNQSTLEQAIGRPLSRGDLYMAHFLGAGGATAFLKALASSGNTPAANILPEAAAANPSIFYDASGHAKTVSVIYNEVAGKIEQAASAYGGTEPAAGTSFGVAGMLGGSGDPSGAMFNPSIDWSGVKLSPQLMQMLDIVAMAALKMTDDATSGQPQMPQSLDSRTPRPL